MRTNNEGIRRRCGSWFGALVMLVLLSWPSIPAQVPSVGAVPAGPRRIEENDPSVVYTGIWLTQRRSDLSGGSIVESPYPVSSASLSFVGTGVRWIGFKAPWGGIAQVYLDGALQATVDSYAASEQAQAGMYSATGLPAGAHVITIKVTGAWNPAGCCSWVVVDAFDVM